MPDRYIERYLGIDRAKSVARRIEHETQATAGDDYTILEHLRGALSDTDREALDRIITRTAAQAFLLGAELEERGNVGGAVSTRMDVLIPGFNRRIQER